MSRGDGKWQRVILAAVEAAPAGSYLIDLLPVGHTRAQAVALERAAINLETERKIERGYDRGTVVIRKSTNQSESSAPPWEQREADLDEGREADLDMGEIRAWRQGEAGDAQDRADRGAADQVVGERMGDEEWGEDVWEQYGDD
jgi:hypothetical protein